MRRAQSIVTFVAGLVGCQPAGQSDELEGVRRELASVQEEVSRLRAQVESLEKSPAERSGSPGGEVLPVQPEDVATPPAGAPRLPATCADNRCTVARKDLEAALDDPGFIRVARVVPAMKDDAMQGFKVYAIRPGSPLAVLGLRNGDVVTALGGTPLTSTEAAVAIYAELRKRATWTIEGLRQGAPFTITIEIRD